MATPVPVLEKGYDLLLEKPFCVNEEEMWTLRDAARHTGRVEFQDRCYFGTDLCNKHVEYPHVRFFKQLLTDGVITQEIYDKITYKNAMELFQLDG